MTAIPMSIPDPIRVGNRWLFPDGRSLPVVSGGAGDEGDQSGDGEDDQSGGGDGEDGQSKHRPDDPAAMAAALKKANAEAAKFRREAKAAADELAELKTKGMSDQEKAVAQAKVEGRTEALREAGSRLVEATTRGHLAGRGIDVDELLKGVDRSAFLAEDGSVDTATLTAWLDKVAPATKPVPKVHSGPRGKSPDEKPSISDALRAIRNG